MKFKDWAEKKGMNGAQVAKALGVSRATASRVLNGSKKPSLDTLVSIEKLTARKVTAKDFVS